MITGGISGSMGGDWRDAILSLTGQFVPGGLRYRLTPNNLARERYFAPFPNGQWSGRNKLAPISGDITDILPMDLSQSASLIFLECGNAATYPPGFNMAALARYFERQSANQLGLTWTARYTLTGVSGDTQLSAISIAGAQRGLNVAPVENYPTRGRLSYSIQLIGGVYYVRWWMLDPDQTGQPDPMLVAEGTITGNGVVTCTPINSSGMTVTCTLTYTGQVKPGAAFLDVRWMRQYQIHYSTATLVFPRTPDATIDDVASTLPIRYYSPILTPGIYNYNVLDVDDEGNVQTTITAPADSPITIYATPAAPIITGVTVVGGNVVPVWTVGEAGCTFTVYGSEVNKPINYGQRTAAPPVVTGLNSTTANFPVVGSTTPVDNTADFMSVQSAYDAAVVALNTAYASGETAFTAALPTQMAALKSALLTYAAAIGKRLLAPQANLTNLSIAMNAALGVVAGLGMATADWKVANNVQYGMLLAALSQMLDGSAGRYSMPDGTVPPGGATVGNAGDLESAGQPFVKPAYVYFVVRATKGGVQELNDTVYTVEITAAGAAQAARCNIPRIQSITPTGLAVAIVAGVVEDNAVVQATNISLWVDGASVLTQALPAVAAGYHECTLNYTFASAGWHLIQLFSGPNPNAVAAQRHVYADVSVPAGPPTLSAQAIRGR